MCSQLSFIEILPVGLDGFDAVGVPEEEVAPADAPADAVADAPADAVAVARMFSQCLVLKFSSQLFKNNKQGNEAIQHTRSRSRSRSRRKAF